jgi:hypothetical protein
MAALVDSDITSSVCFLTGVTSGALCVALAGSWAFATHRHYTATVSLLAFYVGYLMTRIGMALPQACVGCYYVCYAENPTSRLFDGTIPDRLNKMQEDRDPLVPTPRFPHQHGPEIGTRRRRRRRWRPAPRRPREEIGTRRRRWHPAPRRPRKDE